ncbi:MAG: 50S ribosomal protein L9 [Nitrospirae bacterium]|nr:50S ribosomal protein L9 [Nitrospirota bacterium]
MKVILREDVQGVGNIGDVLEVARGYARNYLLPRNKAVEATGRNLKAVDHAKRMITEKAKKEKAEVEEYAKKVSATAVTITAQVGKDDKLFGSVTTKDIAEALAAKGIEVDKRKIHLDHPIKELGTVSVSIKLHAQVTATVSVTVAKAEAPAEAAAPALEG